MHGLTHVAGGPDPIPGLLPAATAGNFPAAILALPDLRGYWRLGDGAEPFADTSGYPGTPHNLDRNLGTISGGGSPDMTQDLTPGLLPSSQDDGAVAFNASDPEPATTREFLEKTAGGGAARFDFSTVDPMSAVALIKPASSGNSFWGGVVGDMNASAYPNGWAIRVRWPTMEVDFLRIQDDTHHHSATSAPIEADQTTLVVGTYDGTLIRLYLDGVLVASAADTSALAYSGSNSVRIGGVSGRTTTFNTWWPFYGAVDEVAIYGVALTDAQVAGLYGQATDDTSATGNGWVLTSDGAGGSSYQPPGVEVTHGDNEPVEAPVNSPPNLSGPTTGSGWHTNVHTETAVLYDSSPARFDVPSREWTRVPFNTVRIQRQWETTLNGPVKSAWLADDRGLTANAKNGLLHIAAGMGSPQDVSGWFGIEYPVLDFTGLPDSVPGGDPDAYARAARIVNASSGQVLRVTPGSTSRQFFEWLFGEFAADGLVGIRAYPADNPYPVYASWPARPLVKPAPYPQIDPASSLVYYKRDSFYGGFAHEYPLGVVDATLAAGANLCLQAWQDTPWQLRFSTDHFPNYTPLPYPELWKLRPYLAVSYSYDPESIDHTTGGLL
jgi:hypothetical protein